MKMLSSGHKKETLGPKPWPVAVGNDGKVRWLQFGEVVGLMTLTMGITVTA